MTAQPAKRPVHGVLLLDKPAGLSSNAALQKARRLYCVEKAGHTGVLDPLATGLLPVCFGEAAKFAQYLLDADKAYTATLKLGEASSTGDAEGEIVATGRADISEAEFQTACARKGIVIERKARDITIYSIATERFAAPEAVIHVRCSKGTYIRTLSEDIAKHIGTYAHLTALRRTETAGFTIAQSHTLEDLAALDEAQRDALLLPCDVLVRHLPKLVLNDTAVEMLRCGQRPQFSEDFRADSPIRVYSRAGRFIGLVTYQKDIGRLKALRLMNTAQAA